MKPFLLVLTLLLVVPAIGQEHPPTAAQCQADLAVWGDPDLMTEYFEADTTYEAKGITNGSRIARLQYGELEAGAQELGGTCTKVDAEQSAQYLHAADLYTSVSFDRLFHFVARHNLASQFLKEDAQGKR